MRIIDIDKEQIPYSFNIDLTGKQYTFTVKYNALFDYFTIDVAVNGEDIIYGEKIIFNRYLFDQKLHLGAPLEMIVPMSFDENVSEITFDNIGESVFLLSLEGDDAI